VQEKWRLVPYIGESGHSQILDWLEDVHAQHPTRYIEWQEVVKRRLLDHGPFAVGPPLWEGLGDGFFEVRWGRCRIYCSVESGRRVMMYEGAIKRWRKFDLRTRRICEQRRADVQSDAYDEEQRNYRYLDYCKKRGRNGLVES